MNTPDSLIKASGICLHIAGRPVLDKVDVQVNRGEIVTLIGPNGSGKTSFVRLLLGLLKADQGQLQRQPGLRVGYMPQKLHIDPVLPLSVERFLRLARSVALVGFPQNSGCTKIIDDRLDRGRTHVKANQH